MRISALLLPLALVSTTVSIAQTGLSTKTYPAILPATSDNTLLISADLNGDGRPDLFSYGSRGGASTVPGNVFINNGSGGFLAPVALAGSSLLSAAAIADMNGDGYPDIVGCTNTAQTTQNPTVKLTVYLNSGTGTFKALPAVTGQGECDAMTIGDFAHTGHSGVITVGYQAGQYNPSGQFFPGGDNGYNVFSNSGDGTLTQSAGGYGTPFDDPSSGSQYTNCEPVGVVGGDFLGAGNFDLLVTTTCKPLNSAGTAVTSPTNYAGTVFILPGTNNQGQGYNYQVYTHVLSEPEVYTNGKVADLNGDGKPDAVFDGASTATTGDLIELLNTGNGAFTSSKLQTASIFYGASVGDFNGDGYPDIASSYTTASGSAFPPSISILNGSKTGTFTQSQTFSTGTTANLGGDVAAADFNGDGKSDFANLVYSTSAKITSLDVYTNTQSGNAACAAPTTANTNLICTPTSGETLNSPVTVTAASNVSGFTLNRLYLDNTSVYQVASQTVSTSITAAAGSHNLVLVSYNSAGQAFTKSVTFTVGNPTSGNCIPENAGVSICAPAPGTTDSSPVTFTAGATAKSGYLTAIRIYIDGNTPYTSYNSANSKTYSFTEALGVAGGTHNLVMVAYDSAGNSLTASETFTVPPTACAASPGTVDVCSPSGSAPVTSPFTVQANANAGSGAFITAMRIYVDNVAVALVNNPQQTQSFTINQSVSASSGTHSIAVVAYENNGASTSSYFHITVQ